MSFEALFRAFDRIADAGSRIKQTLKDGLTLPPAETPRRDPADFLGIGGTDAPSIPLQLKKGSAPKVGG